MFYHSTRTTNESVTSKQAILTGIAPDGGLFVTDELVTSTIDIAKATQQGFKETAKDVLSICLDDYTAPEIEHCVEAAYGSSFDVSEICPVTPIGSDWLLELYHGPTCAFKDVALQMLPQLMSVARGSKGENILIVTATSGDTGKAALEGFKDVLGTGVLVFYPAGKVSDIQHLQMITQEGSNVAVCGIHGNFDDAQTQVKAIFADQELKERLAERNVVLSSANSINVGRLVPQITYYIDSYAQLVRAGAISLGDKLDFCVPTGNFGDVLAGYYAKMLGLPVGKLIVASNSNNVLTDFITTGTYDRARTFHTTISPSMDILVSSNLERLLYYLSDGDCDYIASLMDSLAQNDSYTISDTMLAKLQESFSCGFATDMQTRETIRYTWETNHVLIDTHTAVAKNVLDDLNPQGRVRVCLSTANPYKFSADVLDSLGIATSGMNGFACMDALEHETKTQAPAQLSQLRSAAPIFDDECDIDKMIGVVESSAARVFL